jgi:hypothetical protein
VTARAAAADHALRYELDALRALAARVIDEHVSCRDTCRACGRVFPCPRACLAERNLQLCDGSGMKMGAGDSEPGSVTRAPIVRGEVGERSRRRAEETR